MSLPEKIKEYSGYVPPEDGAAGSYYVEGWNDCVEEAEKLAVSAPSARRPFPEHLIPHQELAMVADILGKQPFSEWRAGDAKALLGFVNLHIAHHLAAPAPKPQEAVAEIPACTSYFPDDVTDNCIRCGRSQDAHAAAFARRTEGGPKK